VVDHPVFALPLRSSRGYVASEAMRS
jgi:hypothetical protein